jgi:aspartate racemase
LTTGIANGIAKHIGIVGVSPEGAAVFYTQLSRHCSRLVLPHMHPRVSLHNEPLALFLDAIRKDDWHRVAELLRRSAEMLARCGAQFCLSPDNIVQHAAHLAQSGSPIPWLTMSDLVADAVGKDGRKTVGVVGTKMVTSSSTYQTHLGMRGIHVLPPEAGEEEMLDQIIFGELIYGHIRPESRLAVLGIIKSLQRRGCEAVILACSEAPLLITPENSCLPVYDAADILAEAAVLKAIGP